MEDIFIFTKDQISTIEYEGNDQTSSLIELNEPRKISDSNLITTKDKTWTNKNQRRRGVIRCSVITRTLTEHQNHILMLLNPTQELQTHLLELYSQELGLNQIIQNPQQTA